MKDSELDYLESFIPLLAECATRKAYFDTLSAGNSVLEVLDDAIYEVFPDGSKKKIKDVAPYIKVDMNQKIELEYKY